MAPAASPKKSADSPGKKNPSSGSAKKPVVKKEAPPGGPDIRNFFGQPSSGGPSKKPIDSGNGTGKKPISIDDSDDEEEEIVEKKPMYVNSTKAVLMDEADPAMRTSVKSESKARIAPASKHFPPAASSSKTAIVLSDASDSPPPKKKHSAPVPPPPAAKLAVKRKAIVKSDSESSEDVKPVKKRQSLGGSSKRPTYAESSDEEDVKPAVKSAKSAKKEPSPMQVDSSSEPSEDEEFLEEEERDARSKKSKVKAPAKKASPVKKAAPKKPPIKKASPKKKAQKENGGDEEEEKKPKVDWKAIAAARAAGPKAPGSKEIPQGAPNCLAGLTFVFTGEMESLGRDEAKELAVRYGGRVTTAPSGKTSYVVIGENAGEGKLKKIKDLDLETLDEDAFLEIIRSRGGGQLDGKQKAAQEKEEKKIKDMAVEMEKKEKEEEKLRLRKEAALEGTGLAAKKVAPSTSQLWTTKYAPKTIKEICGNKAPVERLGRWLEEWQKNYQSGFKKPGKDGMGIYRAVLISGPPGIGKTTSAHLMASQAGFNPLELNASDARSKKLIENATNIDNASLDGFFKGQGVTSTTATDLRVTSRTCLIMDEVDGMSGGDRGGVGAMNVLIKKTKIPLILICNDRGLQKMKPLQSTTFNMTFRRPAPNEVRSRVMSILFKEKMKVPPNVVDELVKGANSDIRQVLNMLSTFKLGKSDMNFDEGKQLIRMNEKNTILTPFTITEKLTGPYAFSRTNKDTLNDKMELYFHDISFVPLFMQEHYLKTSPALAQNLDGPEKIMKSLELVSKAADSISDGDLIDRMIHGSEQHWSLLPLHAVASAVKPASFIFGGGGAGGNAWGGPSFPQWLGQNSKQGKLQRQLTDIQIRMRLRVSGGKSEIREQYMPMLASRIVLPLVDNGNDAIDETIECMDEYYLGKEDWDAFVELGVDNMKDDYILKKIPTAVKTAFTRQYNKKDHPIAFHKGDMFAASKKKFLIPESAVPDNEDVFEEDDVVEDEPSEKGDEDEEVNDFGKDKLIKAVKPKAAKGKAAAKKK